LINPFWHIAVFQDSNSCHLVFLKCEYVMASMSKEGPCASADQISLKQSKGLITISSILKMTDVCQLGFCGVQI